MTREEEDLIRAKISAVAPGTEFDLKGLMAEAWQMVLHKQSFGRAFKKKLEGGMFPDVEHVTLHNSPRRDIYRKKS